jgi:hypothetical protein
MRAGHSSPAPVHRITPCICHDDRHVDRSTRRPRQPKTCTKALLSRQRTAAPPAAGAGSLWTCSTGRAASGRQPAHSERCLLQLPVPVSPAAPPSMPVVANVHTCIRLTVHLVSMESVRIHTCSPVRHVGIKDEAVLTGGKPLLPCSTASTIASMPGRCIELTDAASMSSCDDSCKCRYQCSI